MNGPPYPTAVFKVPLVLDRERGAAAVAAVGEAERLHAFDQLSAYNGQTNTWGKRSALVTTVGMLRNRYEKARCDDEGVAGCIRCQTMFLVKSMERLLAASGMEARQGQDAQRLDGEAATARLDAHNPLPSE